MSDVFLLSFDCWTVTSICRCTRGGATFGVLNSVWKLKMTGLKIMMCLLDQKFKMSVCVSVPAPCLPVCCMVSCLFKWVFMFPFIFHCFVVFLGFHVKTSFFNFGGRASFCETAGTLVLDSSWCWSWVSKPGWIPKLCALSVACSGFRRLTSGEAPADLLRANIVEKPFWSPYFFKDWKLFSTWFSRGVRRGQEIWNLCGRFIFAWLSCTL